MNEQLYQRAINTQKDFEYTCLVKNDEIEAWRCKQPDTVVYCFDIIITRFGIAVFGDISTITFRVGSSYGIDFLAGNDIDYYILSKVESNCKDYELDEKHFKDVCQSCVVDFIYDNKELFTIDELLDENQELPDFVSREGDNWAKIKQFVNSAYEGSINHEIFSLNCFMDEAEEVSTIEEAYHVLGDYSSLFECPYFDYNFKEICESTMFLLYMINHAAKQIKKIKETIND